jgi:hypothetical protein
VNAARAAGARVAVASAPGRLLLAGAEPPGPRVSVALDRRALCRVEIGGSGVTVESKDSLTKLAAADVAELVTRAPGSIVARALELAGAQAGIAAVTEWKLPAASGVDGEGALALAVTAALDRALERETAPEELVRKAREAAARAGRPADDGVCAAIAGGVLLAKGAGASLAAAAIAVDPGRVEEALLLVDAGEPAPETSGVGARRAASAEDVASALAEGRSEQLVALLGTDDQERLGKLVAAAGGAAWRLGRGRLVAVWAPPGARGPGSGEAVREALKAAGLKPLAIRVDLRGLEVD